jgi:hypothetical protein
VGVVVDDDAADVADFGTAFASHLVAAISLDKLVLAFRALPGNIHKYKFNISRSSTFYLIN